MVDLIALLTSLTLTQLLTTAIFLAIVLVFTAFVLWMVGRALVGKDKAKFGGAIAIVIVNTIIGFVLGIVLTMILPAGLMFSIIDLIILVIIELAVIKYFFNCGWLKALAIAIIYGILMVVIVFILALLGLSVLTAIFGTL
jgi:hypothetical protein